jgi:hypothetical protein
VRRWQLTIVLLVAAGVGLYLLWDMPRVETIWRVSDGKRQYAFEYTTEESCDAVARRANGNSLGDYYCVPGIEYLNGWNQHVEQSPAPAKSTKPSVKAK